MVNVSWVIWVNVSKKRYSIRDIWEVVLIYDVICSVSYCNKVYGVVSRIICSKKIYKVVYNGFCIYNVINWCIVVVKVS